MLYNSKIMPNPEQQRTLYPFSGTVIVTNPEAQALISIIQSQRANPQMRVKIVGENPYGLRYSCNLGRKVSKKLLLELSAYEGSTELEMMVIIDNKSKSKKAVTQAFAAPKIVQKVLLQETVLRNPSQAVLLEAIKKHPPLGDRVLIGEFYNGKRHAIGSVEVIPNQLKKTPEALEDAIYNLLQADNVRIQEVLRF
jgi:hypothetical protein